MREALAADGGDASVSEARTAPAGDWLAPVREALLARARGDAERVRAEANADAEAMLAQAHEQAEAVLAEARSRGASEGVVVATAARARTRRRARGLLLAAQREAYETLRRRSRDAVRAVRDDPAHPELRQRLEGLTRELAGPDATIIETSDGGMVAEASGRRVECSLDRLADRAVETLGADVEALWSP
jgi:vacuolar-type H+-ATPase subunit E/Vma4